MRAITHFLGKLHISRKFALIMGFIIVVTALLIVLAFNAFGIYKETIIERQQKFLLTISKNAARSIDTYIAEMEQDLDFLTKTISPSNSEKIIVDYYNSNKNAVYSMFLFDEAGNLMFQSSADSLLTTPEEVLKLERTPTDSGCFIGRAFKAQNGSFALALSKPVEFENNRKYELFMLIRIEEMYKLIIEPINTGVKGYTMVKNSEGIIMMHPFKEQIGIDVIDGRKERNPELDYSDLEKLIERQLRGEEGYQFYTSYWWADEVPEKVEKLNGFAPVYVGDEFWVVATTLDYKELDLPISRTLNNLVLFVLIIFAIFLFSLTVLYKFQKDRESMIDKMNYLQELNVALEDLQKSQQQLSHYQKLKTIGTFTSGIAHEINNLLTPILGYSEIILKDIEPNTELHEDVTEIYNASLKAKDVIEQLLIYSRRAKNSGFKYIKVNTLMDNSIKLFKNFIPSNIVLLRDFDEDLGYIYGNETQISQMLINIYTNAIQAMQNMDGTLQIGLKKVSYNEIEDQKNLAKSSEFYIKITVSDTGCGIDEKHIEEIFAPFFTTKPTGSGTGLGLSVVQGIIFSHKGEIFVNSKLNEGSDFCIYLPQYTHAENEKNIQPAIKKHSNRKMNILIVDDNKQITQMIRKTLSVKKFIPEVSQNPFAVLDIFKDENCKYDLVISDFAMPQIDGIKLSRIIKKRKPSVKILITSGFIDADLEKYIQEGVIDGFIVKPFTSDELLSAIDELK